MSSRLIFDIETAGVSFDQLDEHQQDYLLRFAKNDEEREQEKLKVNLYPYTAEVVCIGMLNPDTLRGEVLISAPTGSEVWRSEDGSVQFVPGTEHDIIATFWERAVKFDQLITFNGRGFDGPFMHIRSAMLKIKPTRNLMPYRYDPSQHCDLLDQFTYYGAFRRFSLDFLCIAFGIESPKRQGVTGMDVWELHRTGRYREIAEYNYRDLIATRELYQYWLEYMQPG